MNYKAYIARAFCRDNLGGNLAGVVFDQELTHMQMQSIAKELNFSETIFLTKSVPNHYKAHYYTPISSIDFCGHATVAAFGVLKQTHQLENEISYVQTPVGLCEITTQNSLTFLSQPLPQFGEFIPVDEMAASLNISADEIEYTNLKPQIVSTGLRDIFIPLKRKGAQFSLQPDHDQITHLCEKYDVIGLHVFSLDSSDNATAYCRNFAPRYGIPEESATGSSNGALGCYLLHHGAISPSLHHTLLFKQGDLLNEPSNIHVHLSTHDNVIIKVSCGGEVILDEIRNLQGFHE